MRKGYIFLFSLILSFNSFSQYSLIGANYSQNFDVFGTSSYLGVTGGHFGNINASLNGWYFIETGTNANSDIVNGNGSSNTGDTYNFGTTSAADRTLGGLQSNALNPTFGFYFTNNTGFTITSLAITYTGEQWRLGTLTRVDRLDFEYSSNATSLTTGSWSDFDVLDFTSPVTTGATGALDGNLFANRTVITGTIAGLNIANGTTLFIRWNDLDASGPEDGLGVDDFSLLAGFTPPSSDYFRSVNTSNWSSLSTWESSPDNVVWSPATSIPTSIANTITIRNGDTVTVSAAASADQLIIESGGILDYTGGTFTIDDGPGDDIDIQNGGVFVLTSADNPPIFGTGSPTVNVGTAGILRVSASGLTAVAPANGVNVSNYIYQHQSILEYTLNGGFTTSNAIYFPNVNATTIPIFRTTNTSNLLVGSADPTIINGVFECASTTADVIWQNAGYKTFRNGIRGTGNCIKNGSANAAKFIINGQTAELGGSGGLTVPSAGLEIGPSTTVTMTSPGKVIINDVDLRPDSYVELGPFDLSVSGSVTNGAINAYIKTNGIGALTLGTVTSKNFPIGNTSYNPLFIINGGGNDFTARVENGINNPSIAIPSEAVQRTWYIHASTVTPGVTVTFQYNTPEAAAVLPVTNNVEILQSDYMTWHISPGNGSLAQVGGPPYITTSAAPLSINNTAVPYCIAKSGTTILAIDCIISAQAQKRNNEGRIFWDINSCSNVNSFEVQRSVNNGGFVTLATIIPGTALNYNYSDVALGKGTNLYRIRVNRQSGVAKYSNTVVIINDSKGLLITSLAPNPVHDKSMLTISAAKSGPVLFSMYNSSGLLVKQWTSPVTEGTNIISMQTGELAAGTYLLEASGIEARTVFRLIKL